MAIRAAYGANPHQGINPNDDRGWGDHHWPAGVPGNLLAVVTVPGNVRIVIRRELAELVSLMYQIAQVKYGRNFATGWTGGYENRPISGTNSPSNHSKGKAIDNDARNNPMSYIWQCDIPPELVADWEALGWYWGGRYSGKTDTMHFEYIGTPGDVDGHVKKARAILAAVQAPNTPAPTPTPAPVDTTPTPSHYEPYRQGLAAGSRMLQELNAGDDVKELQRLANNGYPPMAVQVDGYFGPLTTALVRKIQAGFKLNADGVVGPKTWAVFGIGKPAAPKPLPAPTPFPGTVKRGSTGIIVKDVQDRLVERGLLSSAARATGYGIFGPQTDNAVRAFQGQAGLQVDGIVGPKTWAGLHS